MDKNILSKNKNLIFLPITIFSLFFLFLIFPLNLKAQEPPICLPPGASIICENCNENYIVKFGGNNKLKNSPLYVRPDNNFIGYLTTTPFAPLHLWTDSPRITFDNQDGQNRRIYTYTIGLSNSGTEGDNGTAFLIYDNVKDYPRLKVDQEGRIIGGGFWASGWVQSDQWIRWKPLSQPPITCDVDAQGATYWKQDEGLYCCLNSQWQKCFGGGPTPPPPPQCGNGQCESGESCSSCPQDCGSCGGGGGSCTQTYLSANPSNPTSNQSTTISWSMTCTGNVDSYGVEQRSASGAFEEWGPTGLSGNWQRGPFSAGTTKMYCTYYYVGGAKSHAGNCITVTWRQAESPQITSFTADGCSYPGPCPVRRSYTVSWTTQYATACTLNGGSVPVNGSISDGVPVDQCTTNSDCSGGDKCVGLEETVTYTLTCTNSAGSDTKTLTVKERWNECKPAGGPRWP
jgi:hypothetical protein